LNEPGSRLYSTCCNFWAHCGPRNTSRHGADSLNVYVVKCLTALPSAAVIIEEVCASYTPAGQC